MIVVTSEYIAGKKIVKSLGLVRGSSVRGRHVGRDLIAHLRNAVGGEIVEYTKMMAETREQALDRMLEEARELGANGIVSVEIVANMTMPGAAEILAYGTAVIYEDEDA